jgi:S-layer homology domain
MKRNRLAAAVLTFAVAVFVAARASAQSDSPPNADGAGARPQDFGTTDLGITVVGFPKFVSLQPSWGYVTDLIGGYRWMTGPDTNMLAVLEGIPNGAILQQIAFYFVDENPDTFFRGMLCRFWVNSGDGEDPGTDCPVELTSDDAPGKSVLTAIPNLPILYRQDVDGDGDVEVVHYVLRAITPGLDGRVGIRFARLLWKRQVSPAPGVASFGDVATDHPFFQHVEALFASGITAGCGGGNYCPNRAITRGEMAVFLAKALGLHWPWDAP